MMLITELIIRLEELMEKIGNVHVECRNGAGEFDDAAVAEMVNVARNAGETKWRIFIDA